MREILDTKRLELRPLTITDAPRIADLAGTPQVAKMLGSVALPYLSLAAETWIILTQIQRRQNRLFQYGIYAKTTGWLIGTVGIFTRSAYGKAPEWELGYWLGQPFWGQGYMREAIEVVLAEAHEHLIGQILHAGVYEDNPKSLALLKDFGFEVSGPISRGFCMARGENVPLITLELPLRKTTQVERQDTYLQSCVS